MMTPHLTLTLPEVPRRMTVVTVLVMGLGAVLALEAHLGLILAVL